ncbi:hypothetical protein IPH92_00495 [Candidatus Kaiserbacteria bacterium]|nr:MAG: hypothetical protein IPH92_00495 [Candidatus Kaiserbacteria bacterium]
MQLTTLSRLDTKDPLFHELFHSSRKIALELLKVLEQVENQWSGDELDAVTKELHFMMKTYESIQENLIDAYRSSHISRTDFDRQNAEAEMYTELFKDILIAYENFMQRTFTTQFRYMCKIIIDPVKQFDTLRQPVTI